MIGIVVVSHSATLADGVVELARGMGGDALLIQAAGGMDLPDRPMGTDPILILRAIETVYSDEGVLVLMDLGSAILSAEMAVEMLADERQQRVMLCEAPLVEGAVAAAVQARIGSPLAQVAAEARAALAPKTGHFAAPVPVAAQELAATPPDPANGLVELRLRVPNRLGLHARPAARIVQTAGRFTGTDIRLSDLTSGRGPVSARSINAVATLGAAQGHDLLITASGPSAQAAISAIKALADDYFGDLDLPNTDEHQAPAQAAETGAAVDSTFRGAAASGGIAIGRAVRFSQVLPDIPTHLAGDHAAEWDALYRAIDRTRANIEADIARLRARAASQRDAAGSPTADIFEAHLLFLADESLLDPARTAIHDQSMNAAAAWHQAVNQVAADYLETGNPYLQTRAKDVTDVGQQVLMHLLQAKASAVPVSKTGILVARDLSPAETSNLDPDKVLGICLALGGTTSHSAILARSMGIPTITGLGSDILDVAEGTTLVMDGDTGEVWVDPDKEVVNDFAHRARIAQQTRDDALGRSQQDAITRDGHRVEVAANIKSAADVDRALSSGAEGVGVFRTELLFLDRQTAPTEDEQYAAYREAASALAGRTLIIRTLDAGGDKNLPYLRMPQEANPYLGLRAVRLCLTQPDLFTTQLRAIVRVAAEFPVKIMFPMIATLSEWRAARQLLEQAIAAVRADGHLVPERLETGIMIEIPAAALRADQFAGEVDFFSIGTNDLTQYTMAAERGNPLVANLNDPCHPAVLELIQRVVAAAHKHGRWAGVCGEMAGDPLAVSLLVGLGVDELSMSAPAIPQVKQIIRNLDLAKARTWAEAVLQQESAAAVREQLADFAKAVT